MRIRLNRLSIALLIGVSLLLSGCKEETAKVGEPAPTLAAYDLRGERASLEQWQGKYVYLSFWASNCGGCLAEMPTLEKLSGEFSESVVVVGINTDREDFNIEAMLKDLNVTYPNVKDQLSITQERYQVVGTPTAFLIAPDGKLLAQYVGMMKEPQLAAIFERTRGERP
ncbi:Thiol-disulfide oxidoreductase resA [Leminorella richardii]|uniref:Thiol-disulfide oxidoreductase resA n=1 Tax=Leminorella richardii TaxID=158841 RepID=A0A2X4XVX3_9GAMM|nr:TlpA disulfide reductase family protein [Leminorella richardii]SQI40804.1 Thiol-disulfide oxidoreductase resA [Leminorella richardii]